MKAPWLLPWTPSHKEESLPNQGAQELHLGTQEGFVTRSEHRGLPEGQYGVCEGVEGRQGEPGQVRPLTWKLQGERSLCQPTWLVLSSLSSHPSVRFHLSFPNPVASSFPSALILWTRASVARRESGAPKQARGRLGWGRLHR